MRIFRLETTVVLNSDLDTVWNYFATPSNLNEMTPDDLQFEVLTDVEGKPMYEGMIINYIVRPIMNIPMRWTTEITHCKDKKYFVDEQRFGPYRFWHHQHHFEQKGNQVIMTDIVHYAVPMGILGRIAKVIIVEPKLKKIFDFRSKKVLEIFPEPS
jgi:ligand-binding SRPBCC domain-containing protein